ncbi:MAG TPA: hypothetical protein VHN77_15890 [Phycisphaerales bacterium]|nr:hypothetical protein [Phycisphaerales bacterium]
MLLEESRRRRVQDFRALSWWRSVAVLALTWDSWWSRVCLRVEMTLGISALAASRARWVWRVVRECTKASPSGEMRKVKRSEKRTPSSVAISLRERDGDVRRSARRERSSEGGEEGVERGAATM